MRRTRLCSMSCAPWRRAAATSARVSSPAATNPCASISRPPIAPSPICGSSARTPAASSSRAGTPRFESTSAVVSSARISASLIAMSSVPVRRYGTATPLSAVTRAMKSSNRSRLRAARLRSGLPSRASMNGASTPADAWVAPMPDRTFVDELDRRAAPRQLVRHRASDDARADDDDVGRTAHGCSA